MFHTFFTLDIETIAGLIPIHLHLQKLNERFYLQAHLLFPNHIINLILDLRDFSNWEPHQLLLDKLLPRQCLIIKDLLVDIDNRCNKNFSSFSPFNCKFLLENRLIDVFSNHFSFYTLSKKNNHNIKSYLQCLDNITI